MSRPGSRFILEDIRPISVQFTCGVRPNATPKVPRRRNAKAGNLNYGLFLLKLVA